MVDSLRSGGLLGVRVQSSSSGNSNNSAAAATGVAESISSSNRAGVRAMKGSASLV